MLNKDLVRRKINSIEGYIREIDPALKKSALDVVSDTILLRAVERNFQLMVDTMLDINTHVIASEQLASPQTLQETFFILARADVLPKDLVDRMTPIVGLRNKLVHEYEGISSEKFVSDLQKGIAQFGEYMVAIDRFLQTK